MNEITITEQNFEQEVLKSDVPVLVDFWATWCQPCKAIAPTIEQLSQEMQGIKIAKIDVDEQSGLAQQYGIMSVPTLLYFKGGKVMDQMVGVQDKSTIQSKLEELKAA